MTFRVRLPEKKVFEFSDRLNVGNEGELLFHKAHPELERLSGRKGDFKNAAGEIIELKTDAHENATNYFFERWRNIRYKLPGGPWQAREHGAKWYVYQFLDGSECWFDVADLIAFLEANKGKFPLVEIKNKYWTGYGYVVPFTAFTGKKEE